MKLNTMSYGGLSLVIAIGPLTAQTGDSPALPSQVKEGYSVIKVEPSIDLTNSLRLAGRTQIKGDSQKLDDLLRQYRKELTDLDAATSQRRAQLIRKLAEAQAAQHAAKADLEKVQLTQRLSAIRSETQSPPEWVIGVVIDQSDQGVRVNKVMEGKPAATAGIQAGDVVVSCNAISLRNRNALVDIIQAAQDQELVFSVRRPGEGDKFEAIEVKVTPVRNEHVKKEDSSDHVQRAIQNGLRYLEQSGGGGANKLLVDPGVGAGFPVQGQTLRFTAYPEELRDDNEEVKDLLKQLIEEVKKLQK